MKSDIVFVLDNLLRAECFVADSQRLFLHYLRLGEGVAYAKPVKQTARLETSYHTLNCIEDIINCSGQFEVKMKWLGHEEDQRTLEPLVKVQEVVYA